MQFKKVCISESLITVLSLIGCFIGSSTFKRELFPLNYKRFLAFIAIHLYDVFFFLRNSSFCTHWTQNCREMSIGKRKNDVIRMPMCRQLGSKK